jgi:hypothetical protein
VLLPLGLPVLNPQQMVTYYDKFTKITGVDFLRMDEDGNRMQHEDIFVQKS